MSPTDPEILNRRLAGQMFLSNPADRGYFMQLVALVNGLMRPSDNLKLPDINEAGAWSKLYGISVALQRRRTDEPHLNPEKVAQFSREAAQRTLWSNYVEARQRLEETARREPNWRILAEYCRLDPSDLDPPKEENREWRAIAGRVFHALTTIEKLSASERERISHVLQERRAAQNNIEMAHRIAELEKALSIKQAKELVEQDHGQ